MTLLEQVLLEMKKRGEKPDFSKEDAWHYKEVRLKDPHN